MYKFRTMYVQTEEEEQKGWTKKNDPRVTGVGKFLRKTSLDEFPQLFNVLKGDMSLVGPRPERPQYVEKFREEIPRYMIKHQVRPGMTGWAQSTDTVETRRSASALSMICTTSRTGHWDWMSRFCSSRFSRDLSIKMHIRRKIYE